MHRPGHRCKGLDRLLLGDKSPALLVVLFSGGGDLALAEDVAGGGVRVALDAYSPERMLCYVE